MSWSRNDSGLYTRQFSDREFVTNIIGSAYRHKGLEDQLLYAAAIVDKPLGGSEDQILQFRNAWQQLRFEYPGIATEVSHDGQGMTYKPCASQAERDLWLENSFFSNEEATSTNEIYGTLRTKPSSYLCIAPKAKAIVLCVQHWHGDGRSIVFLLGRLLNIINDGPQDAGNLQWGAEERRLPLSVDVLARISPNDALDRREAQEGARAFVGMRSVQGLKVQGDLHAECRAAQLETLALSQTRSDSIVEACKQKNMSVTALFHAAACLENIKHGSGSGSLDRPYTAAVRRDLRGFLGEPLSRIENSADAVMVSSSFTDIDPRSSLLDFAQALQHHYKNDYSEEYFRMHDAALNAELKGLILSGALMGQEPPLEILFSSLGKLDAMVPRTVWIQGGDTATVRKVEFGAAVYAPGMGAMWLYFFDGRINMSIVYNTAYRSSEAVSGFLSALEDAVVKELSL